jgi:predicted DNA-binding transcriptional regulator AlpA
MLICTRQELCELLTIRPTGLWRLEKSSADFPNKIKVGSSRVAYLLCDIENWLNIQKNKKQE